MTFSGTKTTQHKKMPSRGPAKSADVKLRKKFAEICKLEKKRAKLHLLSADEQHLLAEKAAVEVEFLRLPQPTKWERCPQGSQKTRNGILIDGIRSGMKAGLWKWRCETDTVVPEGGRAERAARYDELALKLDLPKDTRLEGNEKAEKELRKKQLVTHLGDLKKSLRSKSKVHWVTLVETAGNEGPLGWKKNKPEIGGILMGDSSRDAGVIPHQEEQVDSEGEEEEEDELDEVADWLASNGLGIYRFRFEDEGYDDLSVLSELTQEEFEELGQAVGMKRGHLVKLKKRVVAHVLDKKLDQRMVFS
jgi:hypothetical protein